MSFAEAEDGSRLPVGPVMLLMLICLSITFVVGLVTAFGIMLLLKLNDNLQTSYVILFTPLWVLDGIVLLCLVRRGSAHAPAHLSLPRTSLSLSSQPSTLTPQRDLALCAAGPTPSPPRHACGGNGTAARQTPAAACVRH